MLFVYICKRKSKGTAFQLHVPMLPYFFTEIQFTYSQFHTLRHLYNSKFYFAFTPLRRKYSVKSHLFFTDHCWRLKLESPWSHKLQAFSLTTVLMKSRTAHTELSDVFWMPEAARLRVSKCFSFREVSLPRRVFFKWKKKEKRERNCQNQVQRNSWIVLKAHHQ